MAVYGPLVPIDPILTLFFPHKYYTWNFVKKNIYQKEMKRPKSVLEILGSAPGQLLNLLPNETIFVMKSIKPNFFSESQNSV